MLAKVEVTLKPGLLDAQGQTLQHALESLGFKGIARVRVGKLIQLELNGSNAAAAKKALERMCQKLLANPVVETYRIEIARASSLQPRARAKRA